jgi:ABC-type transport system involved in multi-copper enzyme maturation permease subunit
VTRLVRAELLKVRTTRLLIWLGLLILGLEVLVIALHVAKNSPAELAQRSNQRDVVLIAGISALISLILGIVASAGEFANGTIGHTLLVAPVRERVAAAKLGAAALAGAGLALGACLVAWLLAALLLKARSVPVHLGSGSSLRLAAGIVLASAIAGALGVGFGLLLGRQTAAIVIALVWLLVGEPLLLGIVNVDRYGPGRAIASVVEAGNQGSELLSFGAGLGVALVYVAVAGVLGTLSLSRSDIT